MKSPKFFTELEFSLKNEITGHDKIIEGIISHFKDDKEKIPSNYHDIHISIDNTDLSIGEDINFTFARKLNVLANLETEIKNNIVGQDQIISEIVKIVKRGELGLTRNDAPMGNLFFSGPTGVGKTEVTNVLAKIIYGTEDRIARFDMAECALKEDISNLIDRLEKELQRLGEQGGIILIDEMEKAHREIMLLFLASLDAARFTSPSGHTYNLKNYYFVFTSNIGAMKIAFGNFKSSEAMKKAVLSEMAQLKYPPEFIGRFHKFLCFNKLNFEAQELLAKLKIKQEMKRLKEIGHTLTYDEDFILYAIEFGSDPTLGARPMRNFIEASLQDALAEFIFNNLQNGKVTESVTGKIKVDFITRNCWIDTTQDNQGTKDSLETA